MFRLLPILLVVAMLAFTVRVGEVVTGLRDPSGGAQAAEEKPAAKAKETDKPKTDDEKAKDQTEHKDDQKDNAAKADETTAAKDSGAGEGAKSWPDAADMDPELAEVREGLIKDLAERRAQLETREKNLATREAVLKAAEAEIDQKYRELSELRKQLQTLLGQQSQEEIARVKSLVRIYEGMKPADAARIFNTLDTTILLDVMTRMSERKTAPILAAMEPDRARTITLLMAQQRKLPDLPELSQDAVDPDAAAAQ
jgi:flagellar motility protein MotE (MotC chaperone)